MNYKKLLRLLNNEEVARENYSLLEKPDKSRGPKDEKRPHQRRDEKAKY